MPALDAAVVEDPKISEASIPEVRYDTSKNVDRQTAALLATLPPEQQMQYLANVTATQQQGSSADQTDETANAGQTNTTESSEPGSSSDNSSGSSGGGAAPAAAAAAEELLAVFEALKTSIADGTMERSTGYQTLDLTATVMYAILPACMQAKDGGILMYIMMLAVKLACGLLTGTRRKMRSTWLMHDAVA